MWPDRDETIKRLAGYQVLCVKAEAEGSPVAVFSSDEGGVFRGLATFLRSPKTCSRVGMGITTGSPLSGVVTCVGSEPLIFGISRRA